MFVVASAPGLPALSARGLAVLVLLLIGAATFGVSRRSRSTASRT
jgi:hypothetical protein